MAKFNMKDYENAMKEEAVQDRLQEELEDKRKEEAWEAEINWRIWQEKQKAEKYENYYEDDYCDSSYDPYVYL